MRAYRPDEEIPRYLPVHPGRKPPGAYRRARMGRRRVRLFRDGDQVEVLSGGWRRRYGEVVGESWYEGERECVRVALTSGGEQAFWIGQLRRIR